MRKTGWITAIALGLLTLLLPQQVQAQPYVRPPTSPYPRPPVSPYLNLFRGGNPAINYYGLVRPQEDTAAALLQLQQQQLLANQALVAAGDPTLAATGHPTRFLNYSHYFFNQGGGGAAALVGAGAGNYDLGNYGQFGANVPFAGTGTFPPRSPFMGRTVR